ncbi:MAG: hypothetical protein JWR37_4236 [Mycobacterium sp.]|jgi:hypothetical protein|nr:hypothetical protein [Mycobacterium sp.]
MSSPTNLTGVWDVSIKTPIGTLAVVYTFVDDGTRVTGSATGTGETVPLRDVEVHPSPDGHRVTRGQAVTKPIRLNLDFDVVVTGDRLVGHSRAARLPRSAVAGRRRAARTG